MQYEFGAWVEAFTEREQKEIAFATIYAEEFGHGTEGHNAKVIIAKMARILNANTVENLPHGK